MTEANNRRAVVFAYHSVGVHAIKVLLARGVQIALVVSHHDNPAETIWFDSVAELCAEHGLALLLDPPAELLAARVAALDPDFIFSFYYRHMLPESVLKLARHGAFNLHGSLLPKYRGRVPVNWAVLRGETETGVTLHEMTAKPDAGAILDQTSVPILPDDTAFDVFGKLTVASEQTLWRILPALLDGSAVRLPNDLSQGSYFGGRRPEDGQIDWRLTGGQVYNLHRAVAPPYPGAYTDQFGHRFIIQKARLGAAPQANLPQGLCIVDNDIFGQCGDTQALKISTLLCDGHPITAPQLQAIILSSQIT